MISFFQSRYNAIYHSLVEKVIDLLVRYVLPEEDIGSDDESQYTK